MVLAWPLAILLPSAVAVGLTFLMHSLKGTPEPFYSTLPTITDYTSRLCGVGLAILENCHRVMTLTPIIDCITMQRVFHLLDVF